MIKPCYKQNKIKQMLKGRKSCFSPFKCSSFRLGIILILDHGNSDNHWCLEEYGGLFSKRFC
eukprot:snap_masked-scaffold_34-processed-gene-2.23-mRNA-1 protein AED:1.00 eAED:1.00 QI:0/0/0/0/1/1/3/0/61